MCWEILSLPHTDTAANSTSPTTSAPGKSLSSFHTKIPKWGKVGGGVSVCVYKEHTDSLLIFTVINNVVAQLKKKKNPQVKGRGFPDAQKGLRSEEPLKG